MKKKGKKNPVFIPNQTTNSGGGYNRWFGYDSSEAEKQMEQERKEKEKFAIRHSVNK